VTGSETIVVRTGTANLASVMAAMTRLDAPARTSNGPADVERAERLILPGVGSFDAAMACLDADGLVAPLRARLAAGLPTLGICLGMQLLFEGSDESPGQPGLGAIPGRLERFTGDLRVPQMGWNRIDAAQECSILESGYVYFANSYRVTAVPACWSTAMADHGGPFVAGVERGAVVGCQFHPELSGSFGLSLIRRWLLKGGNSC
jgi:imidazole glycerol phosphate synthase glutamine amidotransferase subunit